MLANRTLPFLTFCLLSQAGPALAQGGPRDLRCENTANPGGLTVLQPRLTWALGSRGPQRAYQVLVASSEQKLKANDADMWDSGKVVSDQQRARYRGKPLSSFHRYYWKVRMWGFFYNVGAYSEPATWAMGRLSFDAGPAPQAPATQPAQIHANPGPAVPGGPPQRPVPAGVNYIRDVPFCTGGGKPLLMDWYTPKQRERTLVPVIIWIHGGGWVGSDKSENAVPVFLSERGWTVASINYRLAGEAVFPAAIEDCKCAIRFVRANAAKYGVNPDKIGLVGSSAGAHLALLAGLADEKAGMEGSGGWPGVSSRVAAVASLKGVSDFTVGDKAFQDGLGIAPRRFLGGSIEEEPEAYRRASPITWLSPDDPPVLLLHGDDDTTVPYAQSVELKRAYDKLGLHAELVPIAGATHRLRRRDGSPAKMSLPQIYERIDDFFRRMLLNKRP